MLHPINTTDAVTEYYTPDDFFDPTQSAQLASTFAVAATGRCAHDWQEAGSADFCCSKCSAWYSYEGRTEEERYTPGKAEQAAIDCTPKALADTLDTLVAATLESDREVAAVLAACRESLRTISWNRYAALQTGRSRARVLRRRQQTRQGGRNHA